MQNVICSGWLLKTGGDGHTYKNTKRRWVELKGMYLFYFSEQPKEAKEMKVAKGIIFLPGCQVKHELDQHRLYFRTSGGKVYYFSLDPSDEAHTEEDEKVRKPKATKSGSGEIDGGEGKVLLSKAASKLQSWAKAIEFAMESARGFKDIKVAEGNWLHKRGGKSHGFVNWKKRRFALRGNLLLYYSEDPELFDVYKYLKGFIDLASITSIDARQNPDDEIDKPHYFKVTVDNEREFFISAQSIEQKNGWMKAIRKQTKNLADRLNYPNLRSIQKTEKVQVSGELIRVKATMEKQDSHTSAERVKSYVVLTSLKLRYYETEADFDVQSFGSKMIGSIPLLGCGTQLQDDRLTMTLHDLQGHRFTFIAKNPEDAEAWMLSIRTASRVLITSVLAKQISISLNTYAVGKRGEELGYTIAQLDSKALTIITLLLEKEKRLEWDELNKVSLKNDTFSLKYTRRRTGVSKVIEFRSPNAIAFFDTISCVMSLRDDIAAKQKKMKEKGKETDPAKVVRRSNSSKAMPIGPKMVQSRSAEPSSSSSSASPAPDTSTHSKDSASTSVQSPSSPGKIKIKSSSDGKNASDSTPQASPGPSARKKKDNTNSPGAPVSPSGSSSTSPSSPIVKSKSKTKVTTIKTEAEKDEEPNVESTSAEASHTPTLKATKKSKPSEAVQKNEEVEEARTSPKPAKKSKAKSEVQESPSTPAASISPKTKRSAKKTAGVAKSDATEATAKPFATKIENSSLSPTPKRKTAPTKAKIARSSSLSSSSGSDDDESDTSEEEAPIIVRKKSSKAIDAIEISKIPTPIAVKLSDEDSSSSSEISSDESSS